MRKPSRGHREFEYLIRRKIAARNFAEGTPLPPTRELAKNTGLSNSTVYRVLLKLADEDVLRQEPNGRFYPGGEVGPGNAPDRSFACLMPKVQHWSTVLQGILSGIMEQSSHYRRGILLFHEEKLIRQDSIADTPRYANLEEQKEILKQFLMRHGRKCDGILFDNIWMDEALEPFEKEIQRAVILNRTTRLPFASSVVVDYRLSASLALSHLLAVGYDRLYFITSYEDSYVRELWDALLSTAGEIGADLDSSRYLVVSNTRSRSAILKKICRGNSRPAVFCPEENHAQLIQAEARCQGIDVPARLGILSGTGTSAARDARLSTLSVDFAGIGARAVDLLRSPASAEEVFTPQLIRDKTTGNT